MKIMRIKSVVFALAGLLPIFAVCGEHAHHAARGVLLLDVYADGTHLHLLIGEMAKEDGEPQLLHRWSEDGGAHWTKPVRVDAGLPPAKSPHRGMDPQIAAGGDRLIAVWMTAGTDQWGSGPMATALSSDGGKTWRSGPNPADDGLTIGHGFIDIAADGAGIFHLTWLDSRDGKQGLRYARSTDHGKTWSPNLTLKPGTCECCSNALTIGSSAEVAILYRDGGPRDMGLVVSRDGGGKWLAPVPVGNFGWESSGCPHVGGGIAYSQSALHAAVWTGAPEKGGVHFLVSADLGATWSRPKHLGDSSSSHPDIAVGPDQRIAVVWDSYSGDRMSIWSAISSDQGRTWSKAVRLSSSEASASHPRVVSTRGDFRVFWTESQNGTPPALGSAVLQ